MYVYIHIYIYIYKLAAVRVLPFLAFRSERRHQRLSAPLVSAVGVRRAYRGAREASPPDLMLRLSRGRSRRGLVVGERPPTQGRAGGPKQLA